MCRGVVAVLVVVLVLVTTGSAHADDRSKDARQLVEDALAAKGGRQRLALLDRHRMIATGTVTLPGAATIATTFEVELRRLVIGDRSRSDLQRSGAPIPTTQVIDGGRSWRLRPPCPCGSQVTAPMLEELSTEEIEANDRARWHDPDRVLMWAVRPEARATTAPDVEVDGKPHAVIELRGPDGGAIRLYLDRRTMLLSRMQHDDRGPIGDTEVGRVITDYSDYREVDGIQVPFERRATSRHVSSTFRVASFDLDPTVDPDLFVKPASGSDRHAHGDCGSRR